MLIPGKTEKTPLNFDGYKHLIKCDNCGREVFVFPGTKHWPSPCQCLKKDPRCMNPDEMPSSTVTLIEPHVALVNHEERTT